MPTFIVTSPLSLDHPLSLSHEDTRHLTKALRARRGEIITVTDNAGTLGQAKIVNLDPIELELVKTWPGQKPSDITVYLPLIDQDRLEMSVEKLCELNIRAVKLVMTERTQQKNLKPNRMERLKKIALGAQKQSGRSWPLSIQDPTPLSQITIPAHEVGFFGDINDKAKEPLDLEACVKPCHVFVGPEGGFTPDETHHFIKQGLIPLNLGQSILRAETAAIVMAAMIKYFCLAKPAQSPNPK